MDGLYKNKYRIASARLQNWNYGNKAAYFITICTHNRQHFFGEIENGKMYLSAIEKTAYQEWIKTPEIRPDMNLQLGEFVVMPNHFHAILIIGKNEYNDRDMNHVPAIPTGNQFGPQSKNLASIIRGFKSAVTIQAHKIQENFAWQSRFYDNIIRNNESFHRISLYIINNPKNWKEDRFR